MNSIFESGKLYKPDQLKNPYIYVSVGSMLLLGCIYTLIDLFLKNKLSLSIFLLTLGCVFIIMFYISTIFKRSIYIIIGDEKIIGINSFKKNLGEIRYDEIEEIKNIRFTYDTILTDIHGNKLKLTTGMPDSIDFYNALIEKAVNCCQHRY